jgi:hypothetical protein
VAPSAAVAAEAVSEALFMSVSNTPKADDTLAQLLLPLPLSFSVADIKEGLA